MRKQIVRHRRPYFKICFRCGGKNPISARRHRKGRGDQMRLKNRTLGVLSTLRLIIFDSSGKIQQTADNSAGK